MGREQPVRADGRQTVSERLQALLARRANGPEAAQLAIFARGLLSRGGRWLDDLGADDAAALVASAFRFCAAPGPELRVRAITPTYATEGWDAPGSVIETCMPDRPFVVDTLRERLGAAGLQVRVLLHPIFSAYRDATGRLERLGPPAETERRESFVHVAVSRVREAEVLARLERDVQAALEDVRLVTDDFPLMVTRAHAIATELEGVGRGAAPSRGAEAAAVADLLRWLVDGAFVFFGYREYEVGSGPDATITLRPGTGLGLLRREARSSFSEPQPLSALPSAVRARLDDGRLLTVRKTIAESPVHRRARMDHVAVKALDAEGRVVGVRRFLGLFSSKAYAEEAAGIPLLRRVLRQILAAEHVVTGSHDHKEVVSVFNSLPKPTLFASTAEEIRLAVRTVLDAGEADVVVAARPQAGEESTAVLVAIPRERFSGDARARVCRALADRLGGTLLDDQIVLAEGDRVFLHFVFDGGPARVSDRELRRVVVEIVRSWEEGFQEALVHGHGEGEGETLAARYARALPEEYKAVVPAARAAEDAELLDAVALDGRPRVVLAAGDAPDTTALRLYVAGKSLVLSDLVPVLENLGLRALAADQVVLAPEERGPLFLESFVVQDARRQAIEEGAAARLADALLAVIEGRVENDTLNRLVVEAGLEWTEVECLRAYAAYAVQGRLAARRILVPLVAAHPEAARRLFECFAVRFGPEGGDPAAARRRFEDSLETVASLREDQLLRALLDLVEATVRTNFFARDHTDYVAFKLHAAELVHLPPPRPLYEIWVHGPRMEGIHLRGGKVARGGIRASDRPDDFRTEILSLMKTQTVKNALIVPTGAKGGFVQKGPGAPVDGYRTLIHALLDLTDDLVGGQVVHPRGMVVRDEPDPYLVVAPDKGTAAFSDVANAIALERGFWLGDAFASGGSHGYDHKALGITARGAWECVRTHFHELGIDADTAPLTVAAIGDPSGDVFGNTMLRSPYLRLRAAFDHRHVFLDPDPDPARAFAERERLFRAGRGWGAFDPAAQSRGGAVVERAAKRVQLTPEAQAMLGLAAPVASGEELVRAVLRLDVDLLFNGGIGTYVKASAESHAEVGDPANDGMRVDADTLRARVVVEGGNLGFTQRARVEYALGGGRIDTDAVDNSAGVDMSDHEVNVKIGLRAVVDSGELTCEARNALVASVTDEVVAAVLAHNRDQSRVLGVDQVRSRTRLDDFRELIAELEHTAGLDRSLEALPDRDTLRARRSDYLGLTRPELAIVMAYEKIAIERAVLASSLPEEPLLVPLFLGYFPAVLATRWPDAVRAHPLGREILATQVANAVVDGLGATFVHCVTRATGVDAAEAIRAWAVAVVVAREGALVGAIGRGGFAADVEAACRLALERTMARVTRWIVANVDLTHAVAEAAALGDAVGRVRDRLPEWVVGAEAEAFHRRRSELEIAGLPAELAREAATAEWLTAVLDVVTVARDASVGPEEAAACYFALAHDVDFAWLWARADEAGEEDRWQRRAVEGMVEDLMDARRRLARLRLGGGEIAARPLAALQDLVRDLRAAPRTSLAALQVVVREVCRLAHASTVVGKGDV
jgi:glutamate dehydrogenase